MLKELLPALLAALALATGAVYSRSISAQFLPSPKVSSALAPLFKEAQETEKKRQDATVRMAQSLISGGRTDATPYSTYVMLAKAQQSTAKRAEERRALLRTAESWLLTPDQLVTITKKLNASEASAETP
jgi:hypothetical protein